MYRLNITPPSEGCRTPFERFHLQVIHKSSVPNSKGYQTPSKGLFLGVIIFFILRQQNNSEVFAVLYSYYLGVAQKE